MRKVKAERAKRVRRAKALRRRQLRLESLEARVVLTAAPPLTDFGGDVPSDPNAFVEVAGDNLLSTGGEDSSTAAEGEGQTGSARLTVFVDGQQVAIPADVGVFGDGSMASLYTTGADGVLMFDSSASVSLGAFFDTWRSNAGLAGDNADAAFSATQLMSGTADATHTVQMFVNGQISHDFDQYVVQDGDQIALVYSSNPVVSLNTNFGSILFELFDGATPITVDNFLNYVNDGDYANSIFHRSAKTQSGDDFVIQGGGFTTTSTTFSSTSQFAAVPTDPPIQNEPGISNLRGTVAMAKLGGDPNSATSQFFVNLSDANSFLDQEQFNSFTVFGRVLDMTTVDTIAALPVNTSNASPFGELPLSSDNQLAVVQTITGQGDLTGVKFIDVNGNGVQDAGEAGIEGATVFADANGNGTFDAGEVSTTTDAEGRFLLQVTPGQYVVRSAVVGGQSATVGGDGYDVTVEIGRTIDALDFGEAPPPAPTAVDLLAATDTGAADDDDLTNQNNADAPSALQFQVSGVEDGAVVRLYSDGVEIGSATAAGGVAAVTTDGATSLSDGMHAITARQMVNGVQSQPSAALTVTIDTAAPAAVANMAPGTVVHDQAYTFDAESPDEGQAGVVYSLDGAPQGMTVDAQSGVVQWTPTLAQAGPQSFTVQVTDAAGNSAPGTYDVTVLAGLPALPDDYLITEGATISVSAASGVLANDNGGNSAGLTASVVAQPTHGTLSFQPDGSFIYTPDADFPGSDSFTYQASSGLEQSNAALVTISIATPNATPQAADDAYTTTADNVLSVSAAQGVLGNDTDAEGDSLTATLLTGPAHGELTLNANGAFTYTPAPDFHGDDSFTYTTSDGTTSSAAATVHLTVAGTQLTLTDYTGSIRGSVYLDINADGARSAGEVGVPGVLLTLTGTTAAGGEINRSVLSDADGSYVFEGLPAGTYQVAESQPHALMDGLDTSAVVDADVGDDVIANLVLPEGQSLAGNNFGEAAVEAAYVNAVWLFASSFANMGALRQMVAVGEQNAGNSQLAASIRAGVTDPTGQGGEAPIAIGEAYAVASDATLTVPTVAGVLGNDGDANGDELTVQLVDATANGSLTLHADGSFSYTPNAGFSGSDSFTYQAHDGVHASNTATVTIDVGLQSNTAPTAAADAYSTAGVLTVATGDGLLANDSDAEEHILKAELIDTPQSGVLSLSPDGSFVYTPDPGFVGTDTFTYRASDGHRASADTTVTLTISPPANTAPAAADDGYTTAGVALSIAADAGVLANDTDAEGDSLSAEVVDSPQHGGLTFNSDGSFTYAPTPGFSGADTFTYRADDGLANSELATVTINVTPAPSAPPVAVNDAYSTEMGIGLTIDAADGVLANDTDINGDSLTASVVAVVQAGTLDFHADGSFTYTPNAGFSGTDTFSYRAHDGSAFSSVAIVRIVVSPPNQAPGGTPDNYSVDQGMTLSIDAAAGVLANDTDPENDPLDAMLTGGPLHGVLTFSPDGSFRYVPDSGYSGSDSFTYRANDGEADSAETTVALSIAAAAGEGPEGEPFSTLVDQVFGEEQDWL